MRRRSGNWSRTQLARALNNLCNAGAEIVGLDMIFYSPAMDPAADRALASAIEQCNNVVLARATAMHGGRELESLYPFQDAMIGDGFINLPMDETVRRVPYLNARRLENGELMLLPSFSLELARSFLSIDFVFDESARTFLVMGEPGSRQLHLPYPELIINFKGDFSVFNHLSYTDVVHNRFKPESVKGKLVIIGSSLDLDDDYLRTPMSGISGKAGVDKKKFKTVVNTHQEKKDLGVSCQAHAVNTILTGEFITRARPQTVYSLIVLMGLCGLFFYFPRIRLIWILLFLAAGIGGVAELSYRLFLTKLIWLDAAPLMGVFTVQFVSGFMLQKTFERKRTAHVTGLFGKYVSPDVVTDMIKGNIDTSLEGRKTELTMLFSDLRSFTSLSEKLGPRKTSRLLNGYFDAMIPIIFEHQGTLDKLIGDAIMAFYGEPLPVPDHPVKAAQTALVMLERLRQMKALDIPGVDQLQIGIGINTGEVTVGNLGSRLFMDYTVIGDDVNLASRLEGLNKLYGTRIIVSEFTVSGLGQRFVVRELDKVKVKGKQKAVTIFELICPEEKAGTTLPDAINRFEAGLAFYRNRQWDKADAAFREVLAKIPEDGPSRLYLDRIGQLRVQPPKTEWDGVTVLDHK